MKVDVYFGDAWLSSFNVAEVAGRWAYIAAASRVTEAERHTITTIDEATRALLNDYFRVLVDGLEVAR